MVKVKVGKKTGFSQKEEVERKVNWLECQDCGRWELFENCGFGVLCDDSKVYVYRCRLCKIEEQQQRMMQMELKELKERMLKIEIRQMEIDDKLTNFLGNSKNKSESRVTETSLKEADKEIRSEAVVEVGPVFLEEKQVVVTERLDQIEGRMAHIEQGQMSMADDLNTMEI